MFWQTKSFPKVIKDNAEARSSQLSNERQTFMNELQRNTLELQSVLSDIQDEVDAFYTLGDAEKTEEVKTDDIRQYFVSFLIHLYIYLMTVQGIFLFFSYVSGSFLIVSTISLRFVYSSMPLKSLSCKRRFERHKKRHDCTIHAKHYLD
jgi:hypothetical protein